MVDECEGGGCCRYQRGEDEAKQGTCRTKPSTPHTRHHTHTPPHTTLHATPPHTTLHATQPHQPAHATPPTLHASFLASVLAGFQFIHVAYQSLTHTRRTRIFPFNVGEQVPPSPPGLLLSIENSLPAPPFSLQGLLLLLVSKYPKVRRHTAEQLYLQLIALELGEGGESGSSAGAGGDGSSGGKEGDRPWQPSVSSEVGGKVCVSSLLLYLPERLPLREPWPPPCHLFSSLTAAATTTVTTGPGGGMPPVIITHAAATAYCLCSLRPWRRRASCYSSRVGTVTWTWPEPHETNWRSCCRWGRGGRGVEAGQQAGGQRARRFLAVHQPG